MDMPPNSQTFVLIDDHITVLNGTTFSLQKTFPQSTILCCQTAQEAREALKRVKPNLIVLDISIPETVADSSETETGLNLIRELLETYPAYNFVIQSANLNPLIRIRPTIEIHQGGFTTVNKGEPIEALIKRTNWAIDGLIFMSPTLRKHLEIKPEWLQVLNLAVRHALNDRAIARKMNVAERTVRNYWAKLQDLLEVYHEDGKILRMQTELKAREKGLID